MEKNIPEDTDGRTVNSALGQRNRGQTTRMSIDLTRAEQKKFLMEAVDHNMTLRGYFYHCWRAYQKAQGLDTGHEADAVEPEVMTPEGVAAAAVASAKKRRATNA